MLHDDGWNIPEGALAYDTIIIRFAVTSDSGLDTAVEQSHLIKLCQKFVGGRISLAIQLSGGRYPYLASVEGMGKGHVEMQGEQKVRIYAGGKFGPLPEGHINIFGVRQVHLYVLVLFQLLFHVQRHCHGVCFFGDWQIICSQIAAAVARINDDYNWFCRACPKCRQRRQWYRHHSKTQKGCDCFSECYSHQISP